MDQHYTVVREEHRNYVTVQKHIMVRQQQQEEPVKPSMRSLSAAEFPELYHLNMPTHQQKESDDYYYYRSSSSTAPSKYMMKDYDTTSYGGGGGGGGWPSAVKPASHPQVHVCNCQRPPVANQVHRCYAVPPQGQNEKVVFYQGNYHSHQPTQQPAANVMDSNEAAKRYGGILIKEFGRKLPAVRV